MIYCDKCTGSIITPFMSTDEKYCHTCKEFTGYPLKPGQPSLLINGKVGNEKLVHPEGPAARQEDNRA